MSAQVKIIKGSYRGMPVEGIFRLVRPYQEGARGGFITIYNPTPKLGTPNAQRIHVEPGGFTLLDAAGNELASHIELETIAGSPGVHVKTNYEREFTETETDPQAIERIRKTFSLVDRVVDAASLGTMKGVIVSGPPGIGKSHNVENRLSYNTMMRVLSGKGKPYEIVSGGVSAIGLYQLLYHSRMPKNVLVFDDCDGIFFDEECLTLFKPAMNASDKRKIAWHKESRILEDAGIDNEFEYQGSIIFLTNIDFERTIAKGSRIGDHLSAIMSRCHYLDLEMSSLRDRLLRIRQMIDDGMLAEYEFEHEEEEIIFNFIKDNTDHIREVSLRMAKKIADLMKADPVGWHELATATCLQREARFKQLLERRKEAEARGVVLAEE